MELDATCWERQPRSKHKTQTNMKNEVKGLAGPPPVSPLNVQQRRRGSCDCRRMPRRIFPGYEYEPLLTQFCIVFYHTKLMRADLPLSSWALHLRLSREDLPSLLSVFPKQWQAYLPDMGTSLSVIIGQPITLSICNGRNSVCVARDICLQCRNASPAT